jgi:hypothetical protein
MAGTRKFLDQVARAKPKSLQLPEHVSMEKWCQIGRQLAALSEASAWWLGDWLVYGEVRFPERYRQALSDTALEYQTLRNYAWVARRFSLSRRREGLSFQHHAEVAALPEEEQDKWLDRAEKFSWSRNQLRQYLKASQQPPEVADGKNGGPTKTVVLQLEAEPDRQASWRAAAKNAHCAFEEWVAQALDDAARLEARNGNGADSDRTRLQLPASSSTASTNLG